MISVFEARTFWLLVERAEYRTLAFFSSAAGLPSSHWLDSLQLQLQSRRLSFLVVLVSLVFVVQSFVRLVELLVDA